MKNTINTRDKEKIDKQKLIDDKLKAVKHNNIIRK